MGEARAAVVALLLARDGNRCYYCGALFGEPAFGRMAALTVDHRTPRVMGGTNDPKNLALACAFCNRRKGSRSAEEFEGSEDLVERRRHVLRVTLAGQGYHWRGGYRHEGTFERIGDLWRCSTCGAVGRPGRQSEIFRTPCRPSTTVDDGAPAA